MSTPASTLPPPRAHLITWGQSLSGRPMSRPMTRAGTGWATVLAHSTLDPWDRATANRSSMKTSISGRMASMRRATNSGNTRLR